MCRLLTQRKQQMQGANRTNLIIEPTIKSTAAPAGSQAGKPFFCLALASPRSFFQLLPLLELPPSQLPPTPKQAPNQTRREGPGERRNGLALLTSLLRSFIFNQRCLGTPPKALPSFPHLFPDSNGGFCNSATPPRPKVSQTQVARLLPCPVGAADRRLHQRSGL